MLSDCQNDHLEALKTVLADTGIGISKANIERILQPFVQVVDRNHRNGTGLGLSICLKLAELMGGKLLIESEVGKGSTFTVTLQNVEAVKSPEVNGFTGVLLKPITKEALGAIIVSDGRPD